MRNPEMAISPTRLRSEPFLVREQDKLSEHCAVFGVYNTTNPAAPFIHAGLASLQHRGQEASGITTSNGWNLQTYKARGLVSYIFNKDIVDSLHGHIGIGHNRYSTNGSPTEHIQPITTDKNIVALAHNGNLPQTKALDGFLASHNIDISRMNDSERMQKAIEEYMVQGLPVEEAMKKAFPLFTGAFALVVMTKDKLVGVRDSFGVRPLSLGKTKEGYVLSSETCGIDTVGGEYIRDVQPGEMITIDTRGVVSEQIVKGQEKLDIFELVYFARADSMFYGKRVNEIRREMGRNLAREKKIDADMVFAVPNSAIPAAAGYAEVSGIFYEPDALLKDSYTHRTFINPLLTERHANIRRKFTPIPETIKGKNIIVVDDSIVRGPTAKELVAMLRDAGAGKIHFLVASPPVKYPDFYGIATPTQKELIASQKSIEEIRKYIGADTLQFLSYQGLMQATGQPEEKFNTSCFTGKYPIDIGDNANDIDFAV